MLINETLARRYHDGRSTQAAGETDTNTDSGAFQKNVTSQLRPDKHRVEIFLAKAMREAEGAVCAKL